MKFGGVILGNKVLLGNNIAFDDVTTMTFNDIILHFRLCSGRFHPICLKFGTGGNFEMLITKRTSKLKLENYLSQKNCNFLPILAKIIPSTLQQ